MFNMQSLNFDRNILNKSPVFQEFLNNLPNLTCKHCAKEYPGSTRYDTTFLFKWSYCSHECYDNATTRKCGHCKYRFYVGDKDDKELEIYCERCKDVKCKHCNKNFKRESSSDFCNDTCKYDYEHPKCRRCSKIYDKYARGPTKYCSDECRKLYTTRCCNNQKCNKEYTFDVDKYESYFTFRSDKAEMSYCSVRCLDLCTKTKCKKCKKQFSYFEGGPPKFCSVRCEERFQMNIFQKISDDLLTGMVVGAYGGRCC